MGSDERAVMEWLNTPGYGFIGGEPERWRCVAVHVEPDERVQLVVRAVSGFRRLPRECIGCYEMDPGDALRSSFDGIAEYLQSRLPGLQAFYPSLGLPRRSRVRPTMFNPEAMDARLAEAAHALDAEDVGTDKAESLILDVRRRPGVG